MKITNQIPDAERFYARKDEKAFKLYQVDKDCGMYQVTSGRYYGTFNKEELADEFIEYIY